MVRIICFLGISIFILGSCQSEEEIEFNKYYVAGKTLYETNCQNCHSTDGKGLGKLYPPLTDSIFLKKNRANLYCIIKNGLEQKIQVNGVIYEEKMPANKQLADIEIAEIITYVTNSFGNKQSGYTVKDADRDRANCN